MTFLILIFHIRAVILIFSSSFSVLIDFELIVSCFLKFSFIILLDKFRLIFFIAVILISFRVFFFRQSYIRTDKYFLRFHVLLRSFVLSIIMLIFSPNLISVLLGWDGLGIRSYLLVIYYSRKKSFNSGIITILTNRVGDALIIVSLCYFIILESINLNMIFFNNFLSISTILILVLLAACTKRAQIPFRAWLPAAMAAPTPVSALVHSSTLVTAGVYLIFRFRDTLYLLGVNFILLILGPLTILMARGSAFYEIDIKKIVALSTLSQLGVIITAIGCGIYMLRFFHLLTHAFFKALLFISAGNLIHASERYQDLRVIGGRSEVIPYSKAIVIATSMRLCGLPFISAFYSKEMIIERLLIINSFLWAYILIVLGVLITVFYRIRFFIVAISWINRQRSIYLKTDIDFYVNFSISVLILPAFLGGSLINYLLKIDLLFLVRSAIKWTVFLNIGLGIVLFYWVFLNKKFIFLSIRNQVIANLWRLPTFSGQLPVTWSKSLGDFIHKISDFSWLFYFYFNFYFSIRKFFLVLGGMFYKEKFIYGLRNMFIILVLLVVRIKIL